MCNAKKNHKIRKMKFGKLLQEKRDAADVTQEELGGRIGIDPQHLGKIEQGKKEPRFFTFWDIACELGFDISAFRQELVEYLNEDDT